MQNSITVYFDDDLKKKIKIRAVTLDMSVKDYLTMLVKKDLAENEQSAQKEK